MSGVSLRGSVKSSRNRFSFSKAHAKDAFYFLRQFNQNKEAGWIQVILTRLIDNPETILLNGRSIRQDLVDLPGFKVRFRIGNTDSYSNFLVTVFLHSRLCQISFDLEFLFANAVGLVPVRPFLSYHQTGGRWQPLLIFSSGPNHIVCAIGLYLG